MEGRAFLNVGGVALASLLMPAYARVIDEGVPAKRWGVIQPARKIG